MALLERSVALRSAFAGVSGFWRSWTGELAALIPPSMTERLFGPAEVLVFDWDDKGKCLRRIRGDRCEVLYREAGETDGECSLQADAAGALTRLRRLGIPLILRLPARDVLRRRLQLPKTPAAELDQLLHFEIERQSPLPADTVLYDYLSRSAPEGGERMEVTLRILRRDIADEALTACRALAGEPDAMAIAGPGGPEKRDLFRFGSRLNWRVVLRRHIALFLLGLVFLLAAANLSVAYERREGAIADITARLAAIGPDVDRAAVLQNEIREAERRASFGAARKGEAPLIAILTDLSVALPDDSWIFEFSYKGDELRLRGFTPDASKLLRLLGSASRFGAAEFRAPVMPGREGTRERFDIALKVGEERRDADQ